MHKVFIAEDDENIRDLVIYALRSAGFDAMGFESGTELLHTLEDNEPSIVILDIMLPGIDGLEILKKLRESQKHKHLPVIMLTAKGSEYDKVKGLDMGADDYISKPFGVMELISRVNAILRRTSETSELSDVLEYKGIRLDNMRRNVSADGENVVLTFKEYELLRYFLANTDIALSRDKLLVEVWGFDFEGESRTVDVHVKTLRQKLGEEGGHIKTVRNVGYKLGE